MLWRDPTDPAKGDWYTGMVVQEAEEWAPPAGAIWEGVSVMWDTDSSKQLPVTSTVLCLSPSALLLPHQCGPWHVKPITMSVWQSSPEQTPQPCCLTLLLILLDVAATDWQLLPSLLFTKALLS